jgi:curli biogenesis system outer membrane secretion channel CsgG
MLEKNKLGTLALILLACLICAHTLEAQSKPRVAVVRFDNNSTWHWWGDRLGDAAADVFVTALLESGKFSMIERQKVDEVLLEQDLGATGRITPQTAAKIGKMLGADLLLTGSVSEFSIRRTGGGIGRISVGVTTGKVTLQARLVNTTTGEILVAAEESNSKNLVGARIKSINFKQTFDYGLAHDVMHPAVDKAVVKIVAQAQNISGPSHTGRVIKVEGDKVWINLGAESGAKVGDSFTVVRQGEELIDPDTGQSLGAEEETIGVVEIAEVKAKYSIAVLKSGGAAAQDYLKKR